MPRKTRSARRYVDLSAKVWSLNDAGSRDALTGTEQERETIRTAGEITFRREGESWTDTRIADPLPKGTETIRVRPYGPAYFELARAGGRMADWFSLGERVRVLLPGIVLEVSPDGEETLPAGTLRRLIAAVASM